MGRILNNKERRELHLKRKEDNCCVDCGIKLSGFIPQDENFFPLCQACAKKMLEEEKK